MLKASADPVAIRVAAELRASGLQVISLQEAVGTRTSSEIELLARSVVATIDLDPDAGENRIWTTDRASGQSVLRAVVPMSGDAEVVALHTAEAVRTALRDTVWSPSAMASRPPPRAPNQPLVARARDHFEASLGPAWATGSAQFGASAQAFLVLSWLSPAHVGLEAIGVAPLTSAHWSTDAGSASLAFGMAATGFRAEFCSTPWGSIDAGAGLGAAVLRTEGQASVGYFATSRTTWVAAPYARFGYSVGLAGPLKLRLDVASVIGVPRPMLTAFGEDAASWGWPLVLASVGFAFVSR